MFDYKKKIHDIEMEVIKNKCDRDARFIKRIYDLEYERTKMLKHIAHCNEKINFILDYFDLKFEIAQLQKEEVRDV